VSIGSALRETGDLLDRGVHLVGQRVVTIGLPFVLADVLGNFTVALPSAGGWLSIPIMVLALAFGNRAQVIGVRSSVRFDAARTDWRAVFHRPDLLWIVPLDALTYAVPFLLMFLALFLAGLFRIGPVVTAVPDGRVLLALAALLAIVSALALAAVLLISFAVCAATVEAVVEDVSVGRALGRWLREVFRRRSLGAALLAAAVFAVLVIGMPTLLSIVPFGPNWLRNIVNGIPEGLADAVALFFAWGWRDAVLDRHRGRDIAALLDERDQPSVSDSPRATIPGVTTSQ
jgi:hypothetical protein